MARGSLGLFLGVFGRAVYLCLFPWSTEWCGATMSQVDVAETLRVLKAIGSDVGAAARTRPSRAEGSGVVAAVVLACLLLRQKIGRFEAGGLRGLLERFGVCGAGSGSVWGPCWPVWQTRPGRHRRDARALSSGGEPHPGRTDAEAVGRRRSSGDGGAEFLSSSAPLEVPEGRFWDMNFSSLRAQDH